MTGSHIQPQSALTRVTLLLVSALTVLSSMTLSPALPGIREHFYTIPHANLLVPMVLTLHALFIVIGSPLAGFLVDRIGRKPVLVFAALIYGIAGSAGFVLQDLFALLFSRALLGLATAGIFTSATTLIADYYTGQTRTRVTAWQTAVMNFGGVAALLVSGLLSDSSWHLPFLIYLVSLALLPFILVSIVEPSRIAEPATSSFTAHAKKRQHIPVATLVGIYAIMSTTMLLFFFVPVQLPFYLHGLLHASGVQSGIALAAANLCTGSVALVYGRLSAHVERTRLLALGFAGLAAGLFIIGIIHSYLPAVLGALLAGTVVGIVLPTSGIWIMAITPQAVRGRALSGLTASIFLGQFLSPLVSQTLSERIGLTAAFLGAGGVALSLMLFFALLQRPAVQAKVLHAHE